MDVNGDGKMDIVLGPDNLGSWYVMLSTGSSFVAQSASTPKQYASFASDTHNLRHPMDVDGDGKTDMVIGPDTDGSIYVMLSTGSSFGTGSTWAKNSAYAEFHNDTNNCKYAMDVNGDGKMDLVLGPDNNGTFYVLLSTGTSFVDYGAVHTTYGAWASDQAHRRYPMDVNGDGKVDTGAGTGSLRRVVRAEIDRLHVRG